MRTRNCHGTTTALIILPVVCLLVIPGFHHLAQAQTIFVDPSLSAPLTETFTLAIAVDTEGLMVKGMSIQLTFDPAVVHLDAIVPGDWVEFSGWEYYFFDRTPMAPPDHLHFDLAFLDGSHGGAGQVAVCQFSAVEVGISPVDFQLVDIRDGANANLDFTPSQGDRIIIDEAIPVQHHTYGQVKALYR